MGIIAYPHDMMIIHERFVGTLRKVYDGHIILGVHPRISDREFEYLKSMDVTMYAVETAECDLPFKVSGDGNNAVRDKCTKLQPKLKMEWARYALAHQWLQECVACTGFAMHCDVRDSFFQAHPFRSHYITATHDLYLIAEDTRKPHGSTCRHWFCWRSIKNCYGPQRFKKMATYLDEPVLCSGTTLGTRAGMLRYLMSITDRFLAMSTMGDKCIPPNAVDQPVHALMYYQGVFGPSSIALPYGESPVLTIGFPCTKPDKLLTRDKDGLFLNNDGTVAPMVHQWDRCQPWIDGWLANFKDGK
jgi:hypothetical protein